MKRLLVLSVSVASMLGTGCVVSDTCDAHRVFVQWPTFVRATSTGYQTSSACFTDIAHLDIWLDGVQQSAVCTDNAVGYDGVLTGTHDVRVDAVDQYGTPLLRDQRSVTISDSCSDQSVNTQPSESHVDLAYVVPGDACAVSSYNGSPSFMWFSVFDNVWGHTIAQVDHTSSQAESFTCDATHGTSIILPSGNFTLDGIEEAYVASATTFGVASAYCSPIAFDVAGGHDQSVPVTLVDAASCTGF